MKKWQKIVVTIICILAVLGIALFVLIKTVIIPKATDMVIEKAVTTVIADEYVAEELIESMQTEDREFVEDILIGYVTDKEARESIMGYLEENDYTALKDYAIQSLTPEQMDQALDIAEKYKELLPPEGQIMLEFYLQDREND